MTIDENLQIPYTDLKSKINKYIRNKWQNSWKNQTGNKLFQIKPKIGKWGNDLGNTRKKTSCHNQNTFRTHIFNSFLYIKKDKSTKMQMWKPNHNKTYSNGMQNHNQNKTEISQWKRFKRNIQKYRHTKNIQFSQGNKNPQ